MKEDIKLSLPAIRVNEYEFIKNYKSSYIGEDAEAKVSLKVGNLIENCRLEIPKYGNDKGNVRFSTSYPPFKSLTDAGIEIDFSNIFKEYFELATKQLEEREKQILKDKVVAYNEAWIHKFGANISKKALTDSNFTFKIPTLEEWLNGNTRVYLTYNGINNQTDVYTEQRKNKGLTYCYRPWFLSSSRERNSTDLGKLIEHYIKDCNEAIQIKKTEEENKNNKEKAKLIHIEKLHELFGCDVIIKNEWVHNYYARGSQPRGHEEIHYYLKIANSNNETRELRIQLYSNTWTLSGLSNLTVEQTKEIINIIKK